MDVFAVVVDVFAVVVDVLAVVVVVFAVVVVEKVLVVGFGLQSQIGQTILLCVSFSHPVVRHGMLQNELFVGRSMTQI